MTIKFQDDLNHWIPDELIDAQRSGTLLLFCGAGVSMAVELPGFKQLVENIAENLFGLKKNDKNSCAEYQLNNKTDAEFTELMKKQDYDKAIFYLENKSSDFDRKRLIDYLKKALIKEGASSKYHQIILELASSSKGTRVVTTNFDDLFEKARKELTNPDDIKIYNAPLIPMADSRRWSGIIKIHGSLDTNNKKHSDEIVLSSGDFGRAYLTERWASQFIIDMFKHFHVLFIGYSSSDPIFRYIIDAIAIDKRSNLNLKTSYILLPEVKNDKTLKKNHEYMSSSYNGLEKIFYKHTEDDKDHSNLYKKLGEWLNDFAARSLRTRGIINELKSPQNINNQEKAAKLLKHLKNNPEAIKYFREEDTNKADIAWLPILDKEVITPYLTSNTNSTHDEEATGYLSTWLTSNLDKYEVIDWLLKPHQIISPVLYNNINLQRRQNYYSNKYNEILDVLLNKTLLQTSTHEEVWHLSYICNRIKETPAVFSIGLKSRILELLRPRIKLRDKNLSAAIKYLLDKNTVQEEDITKEIIEECYQYIFQLSLPEKYNLEKLHAALASSKSAFADLSIDIIGLLKDAFDLIYLITQNKSTYIEKGFVAPIQDETKFHRDYSYLSLVDMARDSIKSLLDVDQSKALVLLQIMMIEGINTPDKEGYPILTRLVLYLLDSNSCLSAEEKINLVWPTIQHWFYKPDCKQEASDFLIHIWSELSEERQNKIWDIIRKDINNIDSISEREREICRRITWIKKISHSIPQDIEQFVEYSGYVQETDENLYSNTPKITTIIGNVYSTSIKYEEFIKYNTADHIKKLEEVSNNDIANDWLQPNNVGDLWKQWTQENFAKAFAELQEITKRKFYSQAWENLINSFCDIKKSATEFQSLFVELLSLKDLDIELITNEVCWMLKKCSESQDLLNFNRNIFIEVFNKILPFAIEVKIFDQKENNLRSGNKNRRCYDHAINHPIGYITQALITFMISKSDRKYSDESLSFTEHFNNLLESVKNKDCNIYVKVILTCQLYAIYILIPEWTKSHIIPLLSWKNNKQDTYQYWYPYLSYNLTVSKNLVQDIKADLLLSFDNLECFTNQQTRTNLIHLAILLWREEAITLENISSKLTETQDQADAVLFFECRIGSSKNKETIEEEYTAFKELLKEFTKTKEPVDSELSYWIIRILLTTPCNIYQKEWDHFWSSKIGYVKDASNILFITDQILNMDSGYKVFNLWQKPEFLLKILNKILDPNFNYIGELGNILKKAKSILSENNLGDNTDYINLNEIYTKCR